LEDGRKVVVQGELSVYEPRGQYQLRVTTVELQGVGALQIAFEQLKRKLQAEGLFAAERKRPLPRFPERIGLVTSPTGAAIRDVMHVIQRRNPALEIILAPCRVQGDGAAEQIAAAIRLLNEFNKSPGGLSIDLILVTRGGGSLEDLWAFNEEIVARAIYESTLPVVSAVGHEIDFTISDFVADVRAATPSAGAEIITEGVFANRRFLAEVPTVLHQRACQTIKLNREEYTHVLSRLNRVHPRRWLNQWLQRLDEAQSRIPRRARQLANSHRTAFMSLNGRLCRLRLAQVVQNRYEVLRQERCRLDELVRHRLREIQNRIQDFAGRLKLLGPEQVLARGYSITMDAVSGKIVRESAQVVNGQRLRTRLKGGEIFSRVEK